MEYVYALFSALSSVKLIHEDHCLTNQELTSFYTKNGSLAPLDADVKESILGSLDSAEKALVEELKPREVALE